MPSSNFAGSSLLDRPASGSSGPAPSSAELTSAGLTSAGLTSAGFTQGRAHHGINLVQLHDELWRVTRTDGEVLGYIEAFMEPRGRRFRLKRLIALQKRFISLGEFWSFDDALESLRFG